MSRAVQIHATVEIPFRHQHHRVGIDENLIRIFAVLNSARQQGARLVDTLWIVRLDEGAFFEQRWQDRERGCVAHIVRFGFEGEPQYTDGFACLIATDCIANFLDHAGFLRRIDFDHRLDNAAGNAVLLGDTHQGLGILGKARAAVTGAWMQEFTTDPFVHAHTLGDGMNIRAHRFA